MKSEVRNGVPVIIIVLSLVLLVKCQTSVYRLPTTTYPIEYKIWLNPQFDSNTFEGSVNIKIGVRTATNVIKLNSEGLTIKQFNLFEINGNQEIRKSMTQTTEDNILSVTSNNLVENQQYLLNFTYDGLFQNDRTGMFRTQNIDDGQVIAIVSNFAPQYASRVFPCYDDPSLTANFTLTIQHPTGYNAISSMEGTIQSNDTIGLANTTFQTTPKLSIHSLGFAIVNYQPFCTYGTIKICAYYGKSYTPADLDLVLDTARNTIDELNNYLGVRLNMQKIDIIPDSTYDSKYVMGGFGILNNNRSYYYFASNTSGLVHKEQVVRYTIRQVASLYFGNVMVAEWWDDIWLNQGLSVLFEYLIADKLYPEFDEMNQFLSKLYESGFIHQVIKTTHSSTQLPESLFSSGIEYKAAGILYMLKNIVGEDIFKIGLRTFLADASNLINSQHFFNVLSQFAISGRMIPATYNLNDIMNKWLNQTGYPYVWIIRNYGEITDDSIQIIQNDSINVYGGIYALNNWWIPYTCNNQFDSTTAWSNTSASHWLENNNKHTIYYNFETPVDVNSWLLCNKNQTGFYYINYDPNNYRLLANQLNRDHTVISSLTRAQLVHIGFETALNNQNNLSLMFELGNYIQREDTYTPLNTFINHFMELALKFYGTEAYDNVINFIANKIGPAYERVRTTELYANISHLSFNDQKLRQKIVQMACFSGYQNCLIDMNVLLTNVVSNRTATDVMQKLVMDELATSILNYGMVLADSNLFWRMVTLASEYDELAISLAYVQNLQLIDHLFSILTIQHFDLINGVQIAISTPKRAQILGALSLNLAALDKTLDFIIDRSSFIGNLLGYDYKEALIRISQSAKTKERLEKLRQIIELQDSLNLEAELKSAEVNVEWCDMRMSEFTNTLSSIKERDDDDSGAETVTNSMILLLTLVFGSQLIYTLL